MALTSAIFTGNSPVPGTDTANFTYNGAADFIVTSADVFALGLGIVSYAASVGDAGRTTVYEINSNGGADTIFLDDAPISVVPGTFGAHYLVNAGGGSDTVLGSSNGDIINGEGGGDFLLGFGGADEIYGGNAGDLIDGGAGNDYLSGDDGNDDIFGDTGNDTLYGGEGNDDLFGGVGHDNLDGGAGNDRYTGDAGRDDFFFSTNNSGDDGEQDRIFGFNPNQDQINLTGMNNGVLPVSGAELTDLYVTKNGSNTKFVMENKSGDILNTVLINGNAAAQDQLLSASNYGESASSLVVFSNNANVKVHLPDVTFVT